MKTKSINVVALEKAIAEVKRLRAVVKFERVEAKETRAKMKVARVAAQQEKAALRATKKAERIAKLEAKLNSLKHPTGTVAKRLAKKPSAVTIIKGAK